MFTGPISKFKAGQRIKVKRALKQATRPDVYQGATGTLLNLCRLQDGVEIWEVWEDNDLRTKIFAARHVDLELDEEFPVFNDPSTD